MWGNLYYYIGQIEKFAPKENNSNLPSWVNLNLDFEKCR